jgi:ABC-type transport system, involved in lipoprotein release, permease component
MISHLTFANMRKKKSTCITLIIFILLAAAFLDIGVTMITETNRFYDRKETQTKCAQFIAVCSTNNYKKEFEEFVFKDKRIQEAEKEEVLFMPETKNNKNNSKQGMFLFNLDTSRKIAPFQPIDEDKSISKDKAIYLPVSLKEQNVSIGDDYVITYKNTSYTFQVAGFFETLYFSSNYSAYLKCFLPKEGYEKLYDQIGRAYILSARLKESGKNSQSAAEAFKKDFSDATDINSIASNIKMPCFCSSDIKDMYMSLFNTIAAVLIVFAFVICIIIMFVIFSMVAEAIDESMQNIGVLQAIGYTTKQIMGSYILEFMMLSMIGGVGGIIVSYAFMPFMAKTLNSSGIVWIISLHIPIDLICFTIILLLIGLTSFTGTFRILKLPPVKALNKNTGSHNFTKNFIPLHKGIGTVNVRIALKNIFSSLKSSLIFMIIIAGGTFVIGIGVTMYLNFSYDNSAIFKMCGFELSDLQITVTRNTDAKAFAKQLLTLKEIRKTNLSDVTSIKVEDDEVSAIVSDDFNAMEVLSVYEGSMPRYDNEIAITGILSKKLGKGIGDAIKVSAGGRSSDYYITGIYQSTNNGGYMALISYDALKQLRPQYKMDGIDVYLKNGMDKEQLKKKLRTLYKVAIKDDASSAKDSTDNNDKYSKAKKIADEKIAKLLSDYGVNSISYSVMLNGKIILSGDSSAYKIQEIEDLKSYLKGQLNSYGTMMSGMIAVIVIIIFLITGGILSITIKSMIRRRKEEYGIYKSMGYTTKDLVKQLSLSFTLTTLLGTLIGSFATITLSSNIFQLLFSSIGLTRVEIQVNYALVLLIAVCIIVYIYFLAMWKAYKIKKISAYELLTE